MSERASVGIRELRQDLSRYLARVKKGERLVVTDRNKPVAMLGPLPERDDFWESMIAEGKIIVATGTLEDLRELPPIELDDPYAGTQALEEIRREPWEDGPAA